MKYKHIIWDWNGTLFNDVNLSVEIMNNLLIKNNKTPISLENYREVFTFPVIRFYEKVGFDNESFPVISAQFIKEYEERRLECSIFKGSKEFLKRTVDLDITQSVLSAYKHSTLLEIIEHFDLAQYFIKLIGQDDIYARGKIEQGMKWIEELGLDKKDVIMIGDTHHDFEVASKVGIDCVLISQGHNESHILIATKKLVVSDFSHLSRVLFEE